MASSSSLSKSTDCHPESFLLEMPPGADVVDTLALTPADCRDRKYSDEELLCFLFRRKAAGRSLKTSTANDQNMEITDIHADLELHPIHIMRALGVDLQETLLLQDCYYFFSETSYRHKKATVERKMINSDGLSCWSQAEEKRTFIMKDDVTSEVGIGEKRKFTFANEPVKVGSNKYGFELHEFITHFYESQVNHSKIISRRQIPFYFLCIYKLIPIMQTHVWQPRFRSLSEILADEDALASGDSFAGPAAGQGLQD